MDKETLERAKFLDMLIKKYSDEAEKILKQRKQNRHNLSIRITAGLNDNYCNVYVPQDLQEEIINKVMLYFEQKVSEAEKELERRCVENDQFEGAERCRKLFEEILKMSTTE